MKQKKDNIKVELDLLTKINTKRFKKLGFHLDIQKLKEKIDLDPKEVKLGKLVARVTYPKLKLIAKIFYDDIIFLTVFLPQAESSELLWPLVKSSTHRSVAQVIKTAVLFMQNFQPVFQETYKSHHIYTRSDWYGSWGYILVTKGGRIEIRKGPFKDKSQTLKKARERVEEEIKFKQRFNKQESSGYSTSKPLT